ncbi:MAG: NUDIX domain-containing protein [Solirubrobacteraceae bacterium]
MPLSVRARRLAYRAAYRLLQVVWFVLRPQVSGVKCLITHGDHILLVRHTYGPRAWDLPGGTMRRGETPLGTARREMAEELGIEGADWIDAGQVHGRESRRNDLIYCFATELPGLEVTPDPVELATAQWFPQGDLPTDLARYVRPILTSVGSPKPGARA